jgi:hypothetical protein
MKLMASDGRPEEGRVVGWAGESGAPWKMC